MIMTEFQYNTLAHALLTAVPELKSEYEEAEQECLEPEWVHMVFVVVVNPHVSALLDTEGHDEELRRIFAFLEQMAQHEDSEIRSVLPLSFFGMLWKKRQKWVPKAQQYMGEATRRSFEEFRVSVPGEIS